MPQTQVTLVSPSTRYTFRGNLRDSRHGWLRLTPAYSLHLVRELVDSRRRKDLPVLDPFCGTGTTLLVCAERGVSCDSIDLNPFLLWLARAKVARYDSRRIERAERAVGAMARAARSTRKSDDWVPALHRIERWWDAATLAALGRAFAALRCDEAKSRDLCLLAFCRALMATSNASFRHQSMSFAKASGRSAGEARARVETALLQGFASLGQGAASELGPGKRRALLGDSRAVATRVGPARYGSLITSPPYANRMSYIRELRPYMYWLGFLSDGRSAGELDWKAIGGTWGIATSNLARWQAPARTGAARRSSSALTQKISRIEEKSPILARYVERYVVDMRAHIASAASVIAPGGEVHYVVGNSKFFDVVVPIEELLATELRKAGFARTTVRVLRKRTSKPELFEFCVSARAPD